MDWLRKKAPEFGRSIVHPGIQLPVFTYNITRPYPYKWFTPVAIVGGILLTILFTALNFYSNAVTPLTITTKELDYFENYRLSGLPGLLANFSASKNQPSCQAINIPVGTNLRTDPSILSYKLLNSELSYYRGGKIRDCEIISMRTEFDTFQEEISDWTVTVVCLVECLVEIIYDGNARVTLETRYGQRTDTSPYRMVDRGKGRATLDPRYVDGLTWVNLLLLASWLETLTAITSQTIQTPQKPKLAEIGMYEDPASIMPRYNLSKGTVAYTKNDDDDLFVGDYVWYNNDHTRRYTNCTTWPTAGNNSWPEISSPLVRLGEAMMMAVYVDFGQANRSRIISSPGVAESWTANLSTIFDRGTIQFGNYSEILLELRVFSSQDLLSDIEVTLSKSFSAVFASTYICQIYTLKQPFRIFISILVADLVLLRAAWSLYNIIVGYFVKSRHPESNVCDDCLSRKKVDEAETSTPMLPGVVKLDGCVEDTIELHDLGPASPPAQQYDRQSMQRLLTHRDV